MATPSESPTRTARQSVEAAVVHIRENAQLNAFEQVCSDTALADADALDAGGPGSDGPLAGIPVAVKAENDVAGLVTTYGGRSNSTPAAADSEIVRRLRAAGAVVVGTTVMPEFGQFPFSESAANGQVRNPWQPTHSTGGSSGGSAAAVAAGIVPIAVGGDGGGSIRIPASCCGLVGLKPARGRVSTAPNPTLWGALGPLGVLTADARTAALAYDVIRGNTPTDRYTLPAPELSFTDQVSQEPGRLRIALVTRPAPGPVRVDREVLAAVNTIAQRLRDLGHEVVEEGGSWPDATASFVPQFFHAIREEAALMEHPERLEWRTRSTARLGVWARPGILRAALREGERLTGRVERRFAAYDLVLSPTLACRTPRLGQLDATGSVHALLRSMPMIAFTTLANVTGHPAISVPAGVDRDGLPIGAQLMALAPEEGRLLAVAAQLEE
ncbi:MAG TPA: amidase family protein [Marmoricola sp.]|nr:amidase family protein [Marmoricola sp.]